MTRTRWSVLMVGCLAAAVVTFSAVRGGSSPDDSRRLESVTEAEAVAELEEAVDATLRNDEEGLCRLSASPRFCRQTLRALDRPWPSTPPEVRGSREVGDEVTGGSDGSTGRLLFVCGVDGVGDPYGGNVLVIEGARGPKLVHSVFWADLGYAEDSTGSGDESSQELSDIDQPPAPAGC